MPSCTMIHPSRTNPEHKKRRVQTFLLFFRNVRPRRLCASSSSPRVDRSRSSSVPPQIATARGALFPSPDSRRRAPTVAQLRPAHVPRSLPIHPDIYLCRSLSPNTAPLHAYPTSLSRHRPVRIQLGEAHHLPTASVQSGATPRPARVSRARGRSAPRRAQRRWR